MTAHLTVVTVVFEPELALLHLQARSLAHFLDPDGVAAIIVLDNCAGGMGRRARRAVLERFGPALAPRVSFLRTAQLGVDGGAAGWRSQQAAKLLVARRISTPHYVILDAKNHLIGRAGADDFVDATGAARGGTHSYAVHPLRESLERTLRHLGADDDAVERLVADFPRTVTPFVVDTALARRMMDDIEAEAREPFADAFERAGLLEFFLYSGWCLLRGPGSPVNGDTIPAPILWPAHANEDGAADAIREATETGAAWFAVHRRALARADAPTRRRIVRLWSDRGLMTPAEATRFVRRFRLAYAPATGRARLGRRLSRLGHR
ncbi:hypothetical protein ACVWW9_000022 [Agrococcus sp. UYP33]